MANHFRDAILRQVYWITPKWPWTLKGQRWHMTTTHNSQISVRFSLRSAVFELQAILRQMHRTTPTWPWTLTGQRYPIYILQLPLSLQISHCFTLRLAVSKISAIFHFPTGHNVNFPCFFFLILNLTFQNSYKQLLWGLSQRIFTKKVSLKRIITVGVAFWNFHPKGSHANESGKKMLKF